MNTLRTLLFTLAVIAYPISNLSGVNPIGRFADNLSKQEALQDYLTNPEKYAQFIAEATQKTDVLQEASNMATQEQGRILRTVEEIKSFLANFTEAHPYVVKASLRATAIVITATGAYILYKKSTPPAFVMAKTAQAIAYLKANYKKVVAYSGITAVLGGLSAFAYKNGYVSAGLSTASSWLSKMPAMPKPSLASFKLAKTPEFLTGKSAMVTAGVLGAGLLTAGIVYGYNQYKALGNLSFDLQETHVPGGNFDLSAVCEANKQEAARREQATRLAAQEEAARLKAQQETNTEADQINKCQMRLNAKKKCEQAKKQAKQLSTEAQKARKNLKKSTKNQKEEQPRWR